MNDQHADRRDQKYRKARYGMRVSGRSTKTVLLQVIGNKATVKPKKGKRTGSDSRS